MNNEKTYNVGVWEVTYYKVDTETNAALCDDDGKIIEFHIPDQDCSYFAEGVGVDDLVEVVK